MPSWWCHSDRPGLLGLDSWLLAALRTRGSRAAQGPMGGCGAAVKAGPKSPIPRPSAHPGGATLTLTLNPTLTRRSASRSHSTTSATARATFTTATSRPPWRCSYPLRSRLRRRCPLHGPSTRRSPQSSSSELSFPSGRRAAPCATRAPHLHHTSATRTRQRRYGSGGDRGATAVVVAESPVGSGWHG